MKFDVLFPVVMVYVDDLVLVGNNLIEISHFKKLLDIIFINKDLGNVKYFLGFEVARTTRGISLCQRKYSLDRLQQIGLLEVKPASTPMDRSLNLNCDAATPL